MAAQETSATAAAAAQEAETREDMAPGAKSRRGKRRAGGADAGAGRLQPQVAIASPAERQEVAAECTAACCVLCACLPVAALCCAARAWAVLARVCGRWRRAGRVLTPSGSSPSFSDE